MKKKGVLKIIFINIGIFLGILILLNFLIITGWETRRFVNYIKEDVFKKKTERVDPRALLPNYKKSNWAKEYFKDFNTLKDNNYKSYIGWRKTAYKSAYINIDSLGNRITPQNKKVADSVKNVLFLGGSTMWGTGSPDNGTIPAFFAAKKSDYFVKNYGESGYRAMQSYIYLLLNFNSGIKANWVITYDGVNEAVGFLTNNEPTSTYAEARMRHKLQKKDGLSKIVTDLTYKNFFIGPISNTVTRIKNKKIIAPKLNVILTKKRTEQVARTLLDAWLEMNILAKRNNTNFLAVLQPNAAVGTPKIDYLSFNEYEGLLMKTYPKLYKKLRELLANDLKYKELQNHVLDLTHSFDGDQIFYIDWCHVSPNGNKIIADKILNYISSINNNN